MTRLVALFLALSVALATYASLAQTAVARGTCPSMQQMPVCMIVGDQAVSVTKKAAQKCLDLFLPPAAAETGARAPDPCPPEGVPVAGTFRPDTLWRPPRA